MFHWPYRKYTLHINTRFPKSHKTCVIICFLGLPNNELELVSGLPNMSSISSEDSASDDLSESEIAEIDSDSEISNTTSSQITSSYSG